MKPTLEEVKEYFKNAKDIKSVWGTYEPNIDIDKIYLESDGSWNTGNGNVLFEDNQWAEIISYKEEIKTPTHYDNSKGSIYKFCNDQNLNSWEFDIIKRIVRSRKKGNFKEDLEKTKHLIDLYLKEYNKDGIS